MEDALGSVQRVLVLGGTSEIGLAIVDELGRSGRLREVVLACRDPAAAAPAVARREELGIPTRAVPFEALDTAAHASVIESARAGGDIDVVVVAVGQLGDQESLQHDPVAAADLVSVNTAGAISATLASADVLRAQGHGRIVVLSSVAGVRVRADNLVYGASKAGLDGFALGLGDALDGTGVEVTVVRPGFVRTRMTEGVEAAPFATDAASVARLTVAGMAAGRVVVWAPPVLRLVFLLLRALPRPLWRRITSAVGR